MAHKSTSTQSSLHENTSIVYKKTKRDYRGRGRRHHFCNGFRCLKLVLDRSSFHDQSCKNTGAQEEPVREPTANTRKNTGAQEEPMLAQ